MNIERIAPPPVETPFKPMTITISTTEEMQVMHELANFAYKIEALNRYNSDQKCISGGKLFRKMFDAIYQETQHTHTTIHRS